MSLADKQEYEAFYQLHHANEMLLLPNIWDALGAALLQDIGYKAVATSSSAIALSHGYHDGEKMPFEELLLQLKSITRAVSIPVSADVESGYAHNNLELVENIKQLLDTGIVGINFEDSSKKDGTLVPADEQSKKLVLIKNTAEKTGVNLFLNARVDTYVHGDAFTHDEKLKETLVRGKAYQNAGADALFPIVLKDIEHIKVIADEIPLPLNIMKIPGVPSFDKLKEAGVKRISMGSSFMKLAIQELKNVAEKLQHFEGEEKINSYTITSDYLEKIIKG